MVRIEDDPITRSAMRRAAEDDPAYRVSETPESHGPAERRQSVIQRIVRNTEVAISVKELYSGQCQVCRTTISTPGGSYSEAAHIQPLGAPHDGPDESSNILCLCPNHHVMFDLGSFVIEDDFGLINAQTGERLGRLFVHPEHRIDLECVHYHRRMFTDDVVVPFDPGARTFRPKGALGGPPQQRRFRAS